jgi:hypothetical protein
MRNTEWIKALVTLDPGKVWPAANEVIVVGAISLAPLILASAGNHFSSFVKGGQVVDLLPDLAKSILSGQLLFYAMSFVASVVWHSSQDLARPFPLRIWFYFIAFCFAMVGVLENALIDGEIYKLLRCSKDQCRVFARAAFAEFSQGQRADRARQLQKLRDAGAIAA